MGRIPVRIPIEPPPHPSMTLKLLWNPDFSNLLACVAADSFPFSGGAEIEQANEKRASEGALLGWDKKLGRSREGVSKKGRGRSPHPLPLLLILPLVAVFLPFASVWKRKGNGCYASYEPPREMKIGSTNRLSLWIFVHYEMTKFCLFYWTWRQRLIFRISI